MIGLPIGPLVGEPEPVGRADLTATVLEAATVQAEGSQLQQRERAKLGIVERLAARKPAAPTGTR
jgi:hypothetical protein